MKRRKVLQRLKNVSKAKGLEYEIVELTNHTGVRVGGTTRTIGRHTEIPDKTVIKFYEQFSNELGKGWWR